MPKQVLSFILLPLMLALFPPHALSNGLPSASGKWEPDAGGAYVQYGFGGGTIKSVSESSTHRSLIMEGTVSPGERLSIACTGAQPGRDNTMTTIQPTLVMAYVKSSPRVESGKRNEAEEQATLQKTGSTSVSASYVVPAKAETIAAVCYAKPSWANMNGVHSAMYLVQVNYKVVEQSASTLQSGSTNRSPPSIWAEDAAKDPTRQDSGVRFASLSGEVSVRRDDADDDAYEFAELGMILYNGDRIRTIEKSGAVLAFADLSSYEMGEESVVVLDVGNEERSKLSLVWGKVWANVKRMVRDGNMDVEMSQAVAGIKGTIFVCEEDGRTSRVKVLEGSVSLAPIGKEAVIVASGEQASVTDGKLSRAISFDVEDEIRSWDPAARDRIIEALRAKGIVVDAADAPTTVATTESPAVANPNHGVDVVEGNPPQATNAWVLTERKAVRGATPAPVEGGEARVEFGDDAIEMLLAKPYGNGAGGSRDLENPQRLHARYSWSVPDVIPPGAPLVIAVRQEVMSNSTGKWANAFAVGIAIQNNWYLRGTTSDGVPVEPWVLGIGSGRPDWAQQDAIVSYERAWPWNEGRAGDKRMVSVSVQGIGTQKFEYVYEWKPDAKTQ